jgi:hypothetical protein
MDQHTTNQVQQIVEKTLLETKDNDRETVLVWLRELQAIRVQPTNNFAKAQAALSASVKGPVVLALVKALAPAVTRAVGTSKQVLWDDRGWAARFALAGVTLGAAAFGGEAAGVAALGSAIGVPLWLVLGAGGSFLGAMIEELERRSAPQESDDE